MRIKKSIADHQGQLAGIINLDALLEYFLPMLYRLTKNGTPLVVEAVMTAKAKSIHKAPTCDRKYALEKYCRKQHTFHVECSSHCWTEPPQI